MVLCACDRLLHAGPIVLILTALAAIFTVGLGENADGELSAYSVFNRGFQRLLGEVDADQLANQYVGGMMGVGGNAAMMPAMDDEPPENRHRNNNNNNNNRAVARRPQNNPTVDNNGDDDDASEDSDDNDNANNNDQQRRGGQSRKSGKKARRRPLDERREIRRQREAAQAMGLDGTGGEEELVAMQRLIEDQAAARDNQG